MAAARLDIAYVGTRFSGWAAQAGQRTVQGEIESAIARISGEQVQLTVAGRTDAGVHASGQVASFEHEAALPDRPGQRLNAVLPRDVAIKALSEAADGFDARRDAKARSYRYRVLAKRLRDPFEEGRALWWRYPIERALLDECAAAVVGKHDFTAFTPTETDHVLFERNVNSCEWVERDGILAMEISAPSFMRNQVRVLTGTMLEVGGGRRSVDDFRSLLDGAPRPRAGDTAPAHGLYLVGVEY